MYRPKQTANWKFFDGAKEHPYFTFPLAFKAMHDKLRSETERGQTNPLELRKRLFIVGPGERNYSYSSSLDLAQIQGLVNADGSLNMKQFKRK